jgi:sugar phosphate isomerase/epimerase
MTGAHPLHLGYCTNIHPGESWAEVAANIDTHVVRVKALVAPDRRLGVGLRLSARAAAELAQPEELARFRARLDELGLYVFTINGFPYGAFHGTRVKEDVYRPDWLEPERLTYTNQLAVLLAELRADETGYGSISTVPGCFADRAHDPSAAATIASQLVRQVATLWRIHERRGQELVLALEPEPCCVLETVAQTIAFFARELFAAGAVAELAGLTGLARPDAERALRRHLGVCLDTCHAAVELEDPRHAVRAWAKAGIRVAKVQVTTGLEVAPVDGEARAALAAFANDVYLHQVVARRGDELLRFADLPAALASRAAAAADTWRVHVHVPVFRRNLAPFVNTSDFLSTILAEQVRDPISEHFEVETYTWDVLPAALRDEPVTDAIARELRWTAARLSP